jgi:lipoate-protein ligase A
VVPPLAGAVSAAPFALHTFSGTAAEFHAEDLLSDPSPRVVVAAASGPALVLGSRQAPEIADAAACRRAGVDVVRRRSGGGAVLVTPDAMRWFDVVVSADDPRFRPVAGDVGASMRWLGSKIGDALAELGVSDLTVHDGAMGGGPWSQLVCFAGLGPGEVLQGGDKLVGISQRRTRAGSRFQCMVHVRWDPGALVELLAAPRPSTAELPPVAALPAHVAAALPAAIAASLTTLAR